jgi:hypothetical protein
MVGDGGPVPHPHVDFGWAKEGAVRAGSGNWSGSSPPSRQAVPARAASGGHRQPRTDDRALGTGHWALGTGDWALGTVHCALATGARVGALASEIGLHPLSAVIGPPIIGGVAHRILPLLHPPTHPPTPPNKLDRKWPATLPSTNSLARPEPRLRTIASLTPKHPRRGASDARTTAWRRPPVVSAAAVWPGRPGPSWILGGPSPGRPGG